MATAQSTQSKSAKSRSSARSNRESDTEELSGERDEHYDLVSVLYHGLQGADQCVLYAQDADDAGDDELAEFLRGWGRQQAQAAQQAKRLLVQRMGGEDKRMSGQAGRASARGRKAEDEEEDD